ncbi:MAG: hypothetical protein HDR25_03405 [Lachnospiraceae bacterium]|nr:hypothetical protein [Lachnospiraceae bacterium]
MYKIFFYKDSNGKEPVKEYIAGLASRNGNGFVLLHVFRKQTQKTPRREIERAKKNLNDYQG